MSTDDFQTKYASVMESMLKSAIAETTKLFETMVDELKAEISRVKKENENLRARCSHFEERQSTVYSRENQAPPQPCSEKRDTAVQCDLVPLRTMLVEQCQPLEYSSLQIQQREMENSLQDHNYGNANSQMTSMLVKEEESYDDSSLPTVIKQEDVEPNVFCGKVSNTGSARATACGNENEGSLINHICSTGEMFEDGENRISLEPCCHGMDNELKRAQNQPSEPEHPPVIAIKCDTEGQLVTSEEQTFGTAQHQSMVGLQKEQLSVVPQQCHREGEMSISEQTGGTVQHYSNVRCTEAHLPEPTTQNMEITCKEQKNNMAESDANTEPVRRRRGRPSNEGKQLQQPVEESDVTTEQVVVNSPSIRVEEVEVSSAIDEVNATESVSPASPNKLNTINPSSLQRTMESDVGDVENSEFGSFPFTVEPLTRGCSSSSSATGTISSPPAESPQASPVEPRERCSSVTLQDAMLLVEAMNLSTGESVLSSCKGMIESHPTRFVPHKDTSQTMDNVPAEPQTLSSETCDAVGSPSMTVLSTTPSTVQTLSTSPQVTDSPSTNKAKPPHITFPIQKRLVTPSNIAKQQMPSSTCATQTTVQSQQQFPRPVIRWLTPSKPSTNKPNNIIVVPRPESLLMPYKFAALSPTQPPTLVSTIVSPQNNGVLSSPTERPSFSSLPHKTIYAASRKSVPLPVPSQSAATSTDQQSGFLPHAKTVRIPRQVSVVASGTQTIVTAKQESANVPETTSVCPLGHKLSAVVRLTRLPIFVSTEESVSVSRLLSRGFPESHSLWRKDATKGTLPADILQRPSETQVMSTNTCPSLKEAADSVSFNTSQSTKEKNVFQDLYNSEHVPPSTPPTVSLPVLDISTKAISKPSVVEPISNWEKEIFNAMQGCGLSIDAPAAEEGSVNLIQLTSIPSKNKADPHLQMTKTQFLAQLAVSPVVKALKQASFNDVTDTGASSAETSTSGTKRLKKNILMTRLQSHLKTSHTRRSETAPCLCTETETTTVSPKKPKLHNAIPNSTNTTTEPIPVQPKKSGVIEDIASLNKAENASIPNSPRTGLCRDSRPTRSVSETTGRSKPTTEITPQLGSSDIACVGSVCPRRPTSTKDGAHSNQTKSSPMSRKSSHSTREQSRLKKTDSSAVYMSTSEMITVSHRSPFTQHSSSSRQINRESSPLILWRKTPGSDIASLKTRAGSTSVCWPKLTKTGASPGKTGKNTPAEKPRLIREAARPETNLSVFNAKKIAKAAKATTLAKIKSSNQSKLQTAADTSQLTDKKYKTQAVWIPPTIPAGRTSAGGKTSPLPAKKGTRSTRPQNRIAIYQPGVSLNSTPTKAPSTVSPLQPLSVIGGRLLKNQCGECGRVLSSSAALESHVSLHKGRRPFSCALCGKSFPDSKGLKRHGRVHRNGRIHICQECGKGFVYRFGLTKHLQMVHIKIKPFVCQICKKGFFTKRDVEAHIRIHTGEKPFQCDLCEKRFTRKVELNVHLRWHNGEKRHWCSYCGKGFLDLNNLKRHKYIHTGEKPHSCPHCPKHFTQSGHLKKHVKNVHKIH